MLIKKFVFLALFSFAAVSYGDEILKWTDENGKVHYGSTVPESQKSKSTKVNLKAIQVIRITPYKRTESEPKDAGSPSLTVNPADSSNLSTPEPDDSSASAANVAGNNNEKSKCEAEWARYKDSQNCFAPYVTVKGAVKAEAFEHCTEIKQPLVLCN